MKAHNRLALTGIGLMVGAFIVTIPFARCASDRFFHSVSDAASISAATSHLARCMSVLNGVIALGTIVGLGFIVAAFLALRRDRKAERPGGEWPLKNWVLWISVVLNLILGTSLYYAQRYIKKINYIGTAVTTGAEMRLNKHLLDLLDSGRTDAARTMLQTLVEGGPHSRRAWAEDASSVRLPYTPKALPEYERSLLTDQPESYPLHPLGLSEPLGILLSGPLIRFLMPDNATPAAIPFTTHDRSEVRPQH